MSLSDFFEYHKFPGTFDELSETEEDLVYSFRALSQKDKELLLIYLSGLCHKLP